MLLAAVESFKSAGAWDLLSNYYRRAGQSQKALDALEKVIELSGEPSDRLRFVHADLLIDLDQLDRAEAVAKELEEPTYAKLIRGRIQLERGDAKAALESFEQGIRNWPNNAGARYLAGIAARQLGDYDRAISELREAVRIDNVGTDAARVLARIHYPARRVAGRDQVRARGRAAARRQDRRHPDRGRALVHRDQAVAGRAHHGEGADPAARREGGWNRGAGRRGTRRVGAGPGDRGDPEERARPHRSGERSRAARARRELVRRRQGRRRARGGRRRAREARAIARACTSCAATRSGVSNARTRRRPSSARRWSSTRRTRRRPARSRRCAARAGDRAGAIELYDAAAKLSEAPEPYSYLAAQLVLAAGDTAGAEARLREVVRCGSGKRGRSQRSGLAARREGRRTSTPPWRWRRPPSASTPRPTCSTPWAGCI